MYLLYLPYLLHSCLPFLHSTPLLTFCTSSPSISFRLSYFYSYASCFPLLLSYTLFLLFTILILLSHSS
jgi:hypothetical protein